MHSLHDLSITIVGIGAIGLLAAVGGCKSELQADATVEPGLAEAHARSSTEDEPRAVAKSTSTRDDAVAARTGIRLDREIVGACGLEGPSTYFAFDSTKIDGDGHALLADVATCVTEGALSGRTLVVVGHADPRGTEAYNKELGRERAESVAKCLRDHGVSLAGVEVASLGEAKASDDPSEWPLDRRVELQLKPAESARR